MPTKTKPRTRKKKEFGVMTVKQVMQKMVQLPISRPRAT